MFAVVVFMLTTIIGNAQVITNSGSGLNPTYPDLATAITALNAAFISSPVVITLAGNETAPAGGYSITAQGTITNTIQIIGNASTITAPTPQTSGVLTDAIFKLVGADFVTIRNFIMAENVANSTTAAGTNNMTEWGVALLYATTTNGAQNNTIVGNTITLNRTYQNTFGVYSSTRHTAILATTTADITSVDGANSFNKVYSNSISNVNYGTVFIGSGVSAFMDNGNDIGGTSAVTGNTYTNWGGIGVAVSSYVNLTGNNYCIFSNHQINDIISYNTITSFVSSSGTTMGGILKNYSVAQPTGTITTTINNNTVSITNNSTAIAASIIGINNQGLTPLLNTATMNMNNNIVQNCTLGGSTATSGGITGIANTSLPGVLNMTGNLVANNQITATTSTSGTNAGIANGGAAGIVNMNDNTVRGLSSRATTGQIQGIANSGTVVTVLNMNNNFIGDATTGFCLRTVTGSGSVFGVTSSGAASTCTTTIQNNDIRGISFTAYTGSLFLLQQTGTPLNLNISNNTFTALSVNTSGSITFINHNYTMPANGTQTFSNNSIVTAFGKTAAGGGIVGFTSASSSPNTSTSTITNNNFSNITVTGATTINGITNTDGSGSSPNRTVTGNIFNSWSGGTSAIVGMSFSYIGALSNISSNTITNFSTTSSIVGLNIGASFSGGNPLNVAYNTINGLVSSGTGAAVSGITCSNLSPLANIAFNTINNLSSTAAATVGGIIVSDSNTTTGTKVTQNTIFNLSNSNAAGLATVTGIQIAGLGIGNVIERNLIYDLNLSSTNALAEANGIRIMGGTNTLRNNMVRFGAGVTNAVAVNGINEFLGTNTILHNSIYISGAPTTGTGNSYAFNGSQTVNARSFRNNIFYNARSNSGATGFNYAVKVGGSSVNPTGLTINNNVYFANGTGAVFGRFNSVDVADLTAWQAAVGQDVNSVSADPLFVSATDLNLQLGSPAIDVASNLGVTNDFSLDSRPGLNALYDIGADERDGIPAIVNDIQATAFLVPLNAGTVGQNAAFLPQASFTNNGTATQTNVTVRYRILDSTLAVVYNQTFVISTINSLQTINVTFPAATLTGFGAHTIFAKAELVGDALTANDEINGTLTSQGIDFQAVALIDPTAVGNKGQSVAFSPQASFRNNSLSTQTNISVRYRILDSALAVVYNNTFVIPTLAAGATTTVTFPSTSIAIVGAYTTYAKSELVGDTVATNDEISGTLNILASLAGTYTVGTAGNYPSLTNAGGMFEAINNLGASAPLTINVISDLSGETGAFALNQISGAHAVSIQPIVPAIISGIATGAVIKLNGADNVTIDGRIAGTGRNLTVQNLSVTANTAAIWLSSVVATNGCTNNTIRNLEISCNVPQNTSALVTYGILMSGTTISTTSDGVDNDNNTFTENRIIKVTNGIITRGSAANLNETVTITNNIVGPTAFGVDAIGAVGIGLQHDNNATVTGNTVQFVGGDFANTSGGADRIGISAGALVWSVTFATILPGTNYTIAKNLIHDIIDERTFSAAGIVLNTINGTAATNDKVINNVIYNVKANGTSGDQTVGIGIAGGHTALIANNSISLTGDVDPTPAASTTSTYSNGIRLTTASSTAHANITLVNNSIYMDLSSSSATGFRNYAITGNAAAYAFGTGFQNNNNYYVNAANTQCVTGGLGTNTALAITTPFTTLALWKTAYTAAQDAVSIQANPLYTSNTSDLSISNSSPNFDTGLTIAAVVDDITGLTRPSGGSYDIGAYEFNTLSTNQFEKVIGFKAYPNPVSSILNIEYTSDLTSVSVYNMVGQQVLAKKVNATSTQIDMSNLNAGMYLVTIEAGNVSKTLKVFKK